MIIFHSRHSSSLLIVQNLLSYPGSSKKTDQKHGRSDTHILPHCPVTQSAPQPQSTYIADDKDNDQIVVGEGQDEKLKASSPKIRLNIKLCITMAAVILSSI